MLSKYTTDERSPEQSGPLQLNCVEKNVINIIVVEKTNKQAIIKPYSLNQNFDYLLPPFSAIDQTDPV
jgi:hypothetical protein